jgi:hypothetical protein
MFKVRFVQAECENGKWKKKTGRGEKRVQLISAWRPIWNIEWSTILAHRWSRLPFDVAHGPRAQHDNRRSIA